VGDEDEAGATSPKLAHLVEKHLGFLARQYGRRLVHEHDARPAADRLGDLDHLLVGYGKRADQRIFVDPRAELVEHTARLGPHVLAVEHAETGDLAAKEQAFGDGQVVGEVEFLVDEHDAERFGRAVRRQDDRLAVEQDGAGACLFEARQDLDQRRLARAVLAHQRMHLARKHVEIHAEQHLDVAERFRDSLRGEHGCARRVPN